jgi:hypothetical protein
MGLFPAEGQVKLFGKELNLNNMGEALKNQALCVRRSAWRWFAGRIPLS